MKRRTLSEIQTARQIPPGQADPSINYDLLVPVYTDMTMNDIYDTEASNGQSFDYYNTNAYSRDNYCVIPYKVPPMTFTGHTYDLDENILTRAVPNISTTRGVEYDRSIWLSDTYSGLWVDGYPSFSVIVCSAYPSFIDILNSSLCSCVDEDDTGCYHITGYPDYKNHPEKYQCGPLDKIDVGYIGISDAFAYAWSDSWDMGIVNNINKYTTSKRPPDDSSSSGSESDDCDVFICTISGSVAGSGGSVTVERLLVGSNGETEPAGTITVNIPLY